MLTVILNKKLSHHLLKAGRTAFFMMLTRRRSAKEYRVAPEQNKMCFRKHMALLLNNPKTAPSKKFGSKLVMSFLIW